MPYSYTQLPGDGSNQNFTFNFGYLSKSHVSATVDGVSTPFNWITDFSIQIIPAPASGTIVEIRRRTPLNEPIVDWSDGSTLTESDMDLNTLFSLYAAQEAQDGADASITQNSLGVWNGQGRSTTNFADPTDATGLVTRNYFESNYTPLMDSKVAAAAASATAAATAASQSQGYAALADSHADEAAALLALFKGQYLGAAASNPTVDGNGAPLTAGDLYFNTTAGEMRVFNGTLWQAASSVVQGIIKRPPGANSIIATAGQTVVPVNGGYDSYNIIVTVNGAVISPPDVDVSSGTNLVFATGLNAGDEVDYYAFGAFTVANAFTKSELQGPGGATNIGNTPAGNISATTVQDAINELDAEKANLNGDATKSFAALDINSLPISRGGANVVGNVAIGDLALKQNTATGYGNVAIGYSALGSAQVSYYCTAIGSNALRNANYATNQSCTAVGASALEACTTGQYNVAVGFTSLWNCTTGYFNVAVGTKALKSITTGDSCTAVGHGALENATGYRNTAVGHMAGNAVTTNIGNTYVGFYAGYMSTGGTNTMVGSMAGGNTTSGDAHTLVGYGAGLGMTTASSNTLIGATAGSALTTGSGMTILGRYDASGIPNYSSSVVLSESSAGIRGAWWTQGGGWYQQNNTASWSTTSDRRIKDNIAPIADGLSIVNALNPVTFTYKHNGKVDEGFIAQEYQEVLPRQVSDTDFIEPELKPYFNEGETMLNVTRNLDPYFVAAIKQLSAEVESLKAQLAALKA